jgi:arsenite-transporting ATPase
VAVQLASSGQKTIIITSDITPSLSDILEEEIGDTIRAVDKNLDAIEISQDAIMDRWKMKFGPIFMTSFPIS